MKTTYNDVLSGFESADIVGIVAVIHLPQDSNHTSNETPLKEKENTILQQDSGALLCFSHPII